MTTRAARAAGRLYVEAEQRLGRPLTGGELAIDLAAADKALEDGKQALWAAIDEEKRRVLTANLRGLHARMTVTPKMINALATLHAQGVQHGLDEIRRLGHRPTRPPRLYAELPPSLQTKLADALNTKLGGLQQKIEKRVAGGYFRQGDQTWVDTSEIGTDLTGVGQAAVLQALDRQVKGAGAIAADLTPGAFDAGLAETYDANEHLFPNGWVYTAIMDAGTCEVCAGLDGTHYDTLQEGYVDLPDFGPNPNCFGGDRCRCRLVPDDSGDQGAAAAPIDLNTDGLAALTADEQQAVGDYTGHGTMGQGYTAINRYLRGQYEPRGEELAKIKSRITEIDSAIGKAEPLRSERTVYRAYAAPPAVARGDVLTDPGFVSTFATRDRAETWAGTHGDVYEIRLPAGTKALNLNQAIAEHLRNPNEVEFLLGRDTKIVVDSVTERVTTYPATGIRVVAHDVTAHVEPVVEQVAPLKVPTQPVFDNISVGDSPPVAPDRIEQINRLDLLGYPDPTPAALEMMNGSKDTLTEFTVGKKPDGSPVFTPEREKWHDSVVKAALDEAQPVENPAAYFTSGGGASGKSSALFDVNGVEHTVKEFEDGVVTNVVKINPDNIKALTDEFQRLVAIGDPYAATAVHEESSYLAKRILDEAIRTKRNILYDTTGSSDKFRKVIQRAHDAGYETKVSMISAPTNRAIERAMERGDLNGRYVPVGPLKEAHSGASAQLAKWIDDPAIDNWRIYDTSTKPMRLVAERINGVKTVHYPDLLDKILAKANEAETEPRVQAVLGATAFRGGIDQAHGFFQSDRAKQFQRDVKRFAARNNVIVDRIEPTDGWWEGSSEPSFLIRAHDGVTGIERYAEDLRGAYQQEAVGVFHLDKTGPDIAFRVTNVGGRASDLMAKYGFSGGTMQPDGSLVLFAPAEDAPKVTALARDTGGVVTSERGRFVLATEPEPVSAKLDAKTAASLMPLEQPWKEVFNDATARVADRLRNDPVFNKLPDTILDDDGHPWQLYGRDRTRNLVGSLMDGWRSGMRNSRALAIRRAVSDEFGVPLPDVLKKRIDDALVNPYFPGDFIGNPGIQAFVRAVYEETQAKLSRLGIDRVTVYRGEPLSAPFEVRTTADLWPVTSTSLSEKTAEEYAAGLSEPRYWTKPPPVGRVTEITADRKQILALPDTMGTDLDSEEVLLLGGRQPVQEKLRSNLVGQVTAEKPISQAQLDSVIQRAQAIPPPPDDAWAEATRKDEQLQRAEGITSEGAPKEGFLQRALDVDNWGESVKTYIEGLYQGQVTDARQQQGPQPEIAVPGQQQGSTVIKSPTDVFAAIWPHRTELIVERLEYAGFVTEKLIHS